MKILVLNYEFPPLGGGASPVSYELAKGYAKRGHEVDVVTMGYKDLPSVEEKEGMTIYRVACLRSRKEMCSPHEQATYLFAAKRFLERRMREHHYDVNHTHFAIPTGVLALWLKKKFGVPYILTAHGSDVPGYNPDRFVFLHGFTRPMLRSVCAGAYTIVAPSEYLKGLIEANIGRYGDKIIKIPNGIDLDTYTPLPKKRIILSTGRLLPRKGFQHLVRAVRDADFGYELHLCGDGPMLDELTRLAEGSKTKIVFHKWKDNASKEYAELVGSAEIYCLVSERENASVALLEAMSAGCAVVTSSATGCPETVGDAGVVIAPRDSEGLRSVLEKLAKEPHTIAALQTAARSAAVKQYSWNTLCGRYEELCAAAQARSLTPAPKIAYLHLTNLIENNAHDIQMLNSVSALSALTPTSFLIGWTRRRRIERFAEHLSLPHVIEFARVPIGLSLANRAFEYTTRALFSSLALLWVRANNPDAVYTSDFGFLLFLAMIPRYVRPRCPIFFEQHKLYHLVSHKVSRAQEERALRQADHFVAVSEGVRQDLTRFFGIPEQRIEVIPNAANLYAFDSAKKDRSFLEERFGIHSDEQVVVYSGSFLEWKGVEVLMRAAAHMRSSAARVLLIGAGQQEHLEEIAHTSGDRVLFGGALSQKEIATVLKSSDVAVIPNTRTPEGENYTSPLKLFEYMASGAPIVASRLPAIQELLVEGENCRFFTPGDEHDLAAQIDALLADSAQRERMRDANALRAREYSYGTRAARTLEYLNRSMQKST